MVIAAILPGVMRPMPSLTKCDNNIASWNVSLACGNGRTTQVTANVRKHNLVLFRISETVECKLKMK